MFMKVKSNIKKKLLFTLIILLLQVIPAAAFDAAETSDLYFKAITEGAAIPILEVSEAEKTEANAYKAQALLVEKILAYQQTTIAGHKAGLTTEAQMSRFGAPAPVSAPLFKSGLIELRDYSSEAKIVAYKGIMLENEFAFKIAKPVTAPVKDEKELKGLVASAHMAIEVPQLNFTDMSRLGFFDLTVAVVGSKMFIVGPACGTDLDFDAIKVVMTRDGATVNEGTGSEVLGGQWRALLDLVNGVLARGGKIEAGQYFMTGALGKMIPGEPGKYRAETSIGALLFTIADK